MSRIEVIINGTEGVGHVAYGLDGSPYPGYFFSVFDTDGEFVEDWDTRPGMSMSGKERCHRFTIVEEMKKYPEIPQEHISNIAVDLPPTGMREDHNLNLIIPNNGE